MFQCLMVNVFLIEDTHQNCSSVGMKEAYDYVGLVSHQLLMHFQSLGCEGQHMIKHL